VREKIRYLVTRNQIMKKEITVAMLSISLLLVVFPSLATPDNEKDEKGSGPPSPERIKALTAKLAGLATGTVVYRGARVLIGDGESFISDMSIVVTDDRIQAITPFDELEETMLAEAEIVDANDLYAIPGLIDSHVHMATLPARAPVEVALNRMLYSGITDVRDMAGDVRALADLSRAALINEIPSPDIHYSSLMAGESFFADPRTVTSGLGVTPGKIPWMQAITEETDIPLAVAQAKGTWATAIKIYANLPGELVQNIITEAEQQDFMVWSHLQIYPASPYDSLGATAVSHVCMLADYVLKQDKEKYSHDEVLDYDSLSVDHPEITKYIEALAESGTAMDPTLRLYFWMADNMAKEAENAKAKNLAKNEAKAETKEGQEESEKRVPCPANLAADLTLAMYHAGVPIVAGTDGMAEPDDQYTAVHQEIEYLAQAGLSNIDAIRAATSRAAAVLGKADSLGTLEPGKMASMVFLSKDPLANVSNLRSVVLTVKRGNRFPRSDYHHEPVNELPFPE
jgi:imidazolonepropionase-like amidohydrolase